MTVLDTRSAWHVSNTLKPPVVAWPDGIKPVTSKYQWVDRETPMAPEGWTATTFSDATWLRGPATSGPHSPYVSNLYARGRFEVTDPAQVKELKLSVDYYGGAIVYVNGQEICAATSPRTPKAPT